ncbi:MAG TPA: phosphatidylserine decarboxylase family protein [Pseudonocardiaceae bacterium]|nr:phosphatidylserine decarboxylase family protein [Pseudonocardiaceae bacterium]
MQAGAGFKLVKARPGGWLPEDHRIIHDWIGRLKRLADASPRELAPPIAAMRDMVDSDAALCSQIRAMFSEAVEHEQLTPLGQVPVRSFEEFLGLLDVVMTTAPEAYQDIRTSQPAGLIGFPVNALLDWPMATESGYAVFANQLFNQQLDKILGHWCQFLLSADSRYVLTAAPYKINDQTEVVPWLGDAARAEMVRVAVSALGEGKNPTPSCFEEIFDCLSGEPYFGYASWDDFFTRTFRPSVRPTPGTDDDNVVLNACESAPLQVVTHAGLGAEFWMKGQPYSLVDMLNHDPDAALFDGGTVYQAFLSALSYHRWHSPVAGTVKKAYVVKGSYYLENLYEGFKNPRGADPSGPNQSQPFLTSVATRAVIFIEADNPAIGLMCVVPVGMAEVSSCEISVSPGQHVDKGQTLGMFHFGGSTHCLVFRADVNLEFNFYGETPGLDANNLRVRTPIATVRR